MAEYIDLEAALREIERRERLMVGDKTISVDAIKRCLLNRPAADVAPVVHGRWRYFHKQNIAVCTECSFERDLDTNFGRAVNCPNCGAKMDGGDSDEAD